MGAVCQLPAPSWLSLAPSGAHIYAACRAETLGAEPTGVGSDDPADHFAAALRVNGNDQPMMPRLTSFCCTTPLTLADVSIGWMKRGGQTFNSTGMGSRPDWGAHAAQHAANC